ncbi:MULTISPECIES: type III PLP-dependent enzyme [unclassified Micromonospora]|uniref:type III PLP-dependent enzyme n=1 Tax=unclassified Micromonospora TaxID=2617518 RepID=UPI0010353660|nr:MULTISPECIES: type III PLP-dependent enzyme [unclassified Micromonospora]QKW11546.1 type III PLP-dependent enzyme [Verrucosispora sp. NA02020]QKW11670.1 type III PLP-dependent enzyme [Verrucosispora sp. NA02020]TBL41986.1 type III PLP-dependent enzyme [Verrucosispora sp. SN26_14.1]
MTAEHEVQGIGITELAERFGTPMFVYDGEQLRRQYQGLRERLHPAVDMFFSLKANPNLSVCAVLHGYGACAEVSSLTELITARRAGVAPRDIIFLGPGKSRDELAACLREQVYAVVVESFGELELLNEVAAEHDVVAPVALRVNPEFAVKGGGLTMGGKPRQFGIDEAQLLAAPDLGAYPHIRVMGVHAYLGTRILSEEVIAENTARILELAERLALRHGFPLEMVDIGGGLGVAYFEGETDLDPALVAERVNPVVEAFRDRHPDTRVIMELGRYLTAPSGVYVVGVRYVKESMGQRFAVADGGTNHHMAAVGTGSFVKRNYPMVLLNRPAEPAVAEWQVTGPLCTPNDTIGKNVPLPTVRPGDLIGVLRSGAYGPTASPVHFLSHGYPAEVLVHEGHAYLVRHRDDPEDLLSRQPTHDELAAPARLVSTVTSNGHPSNERIRVS